jgi:hypothetical protein
MIDSGATSSFISSDFVQQFQIPTVLKPVSIGLEAIDGHALPPVTHEVRTLLRVASHYEEIVLDVAPIPP